MHDGGNSYLTTFDATIPYKHGNMTMTFCILKKGASGWGTLCRTPLFDLVVIVFGHEIYLVIPKFGQNSHFYS